MQRRFAWPEWLMCLVRHVSTSSAEPRHRTKFAYLLDRHSPAVPVKEVGPSGQLGEGCPDVVDKSLRLFEGEEVPPCGGFVEEDDVGVAALELPE